MPPRSGRRPAATAARGSPILLFDAGYYGTLAAVRSLGRRGIPVALVDSGHAAPALWSRYAGRRFRAPDTSVPDRFVEWLLAFGDNEVKHVLYPTSDELVVLLAMHRAELSRRFAMYIPDFDVAMRVLDKKRLLEAARDAGLDTPDTWFPETAADVERIARQVGPPLMVKPRIQAFLVHHKKGAIARGPVDIVREYDRFRRENTYTSPVREMPELTMPMLQRYFPEAANWVYSVTGFRDRAGRSVPLLGAVKLLQRPRRLGVGLCFESAPVPSKLAEATARLLDRLGYFGVFELEFLRDGDRMMLIDMNPRLYNQVALDVFRGLDLPFLAYAASLGDEAVVERLARAERLDAAGYALCNRVGMTLLISAQRLAGTMSRDEATRWWRWVDASAKVVIDSVLTREDPAPFIAEALGQLYGCVRHPRAFVRMIAFDS